MIQIDGNAPPSKCASVGPSVSAISEKVPSSAPIYHGDHVRHDWHH